MNNTGDTARLDVPNDNRADGTEPLEGDVLPEDFERRLERLREASGLSWRGFASALGVDPKSLRM